MHAIEAIGLAKRYGTVLAVDGLDLAVDEGDVVGLLGPNGAGKTTTIFMLLGLVRPDAGDVRLLGRPMPRERTHVLARTGFAATYLGHPERLTLREMLRVYADLYGAPKRRADEVAEQFGIESLLGRFPMQMSSGQKTLAALARSLIGRPRLLVLDEPTASLDPEIAARVRAVLEEEHARERFTMLITSHNMSDIERLCRRVVFITRGRILADGAPAEVSARYGADDLEAAFISLAEEARIWT